MSRTEAVKMAPPGKVYRMVWTLTWGVTCRWLPRSLGNGWKRMILNVFGAKIAPGAMVYSGAKIYCPRNLTMLDGSKMDMGVNCYNVAPVTLREGAVVSQGAALFTPSHDYNDATNPLVGAPIVLERNAWVAAQAYVGMGVTIGEGAIVGARSSVFKDVEPWTIVGGNPAKVIGRREKLLR